jgi:hypothetical protein
MTIEEQLEEANRRLREAWVEIADLRIDNKRLKTTIRELGKSK